MRPGRDRNPKPPTDRPGVAMTSEFRFGFRVLGGPFERRRLTDAGAALAAYAACDSRAQVECEAYLSHYWFADDFRRHLETTDSTRGFAGPTWCPWLYWDIDAEDLDAAHQAARALVAFLLERYALDGGDLLIFFS